jgi:hypothetical protein
VHVLLPRVSVRWVILPQPQWAGLASIGPNHVCGRPRTVRRQRFVLPSTHTHPSAQTERGTQTRWRPTHCQCAHANFAHAMHTRAPSLSVSLPPHHARVCASQLTDGRATRPWTVLSLCLCLCPSLCLCALGTACQTCRDWTVVVWSHWRTRRPQPLERTTACSCWIHTHAPPPTLMPRCALVVPSPPTHTHTHTHTGTRAHR